MNGDASDRASELPSLPADVHDELLAILFGDPRERATELLRLSARAAELAGAIAVHVDWHDARALCGTSTSAATGEPDTSNDRGGPWPPDARRDGGPAPGATFGDFRIERQLGHGGMGDVFLAQQTNLDRKVALKVIRGDRAMDAAARERFRREARAVANLRHPGICAVLEVGEVGDTPFLAMQYVDGESLATQLAARRARSGSQPSTANDVRAVLQMGVRLAEALHVAHEAGVVHRDIKPGNIMIDGRGEPVLLDFGLARELAKPASDATMTLSGVAIGTPPYMSPEQIRSRGAIDRRTDVYSLAVTLFECLTLHRPFQAHDPLTLCEQIERDPTPDPRRSNAHLPVDLTAVLAKAMEKEPARRYATAREFAADLQRLCRGEPVQARRIGALGRGWRWALRHPLPASLGLLLTAGVVTTSWLLWDRTNALHTIAATSQQLRERQEQFDLLSLVPMMQMAKDAEARISAGVDTSSMVEQWMRDHGEPLRLAQPRVEAAIQILERRALPQTDQEHAADREAHPEYGQLQRSKSRLAALRRATAVRSGKSTFAAGVSSVKPSWATLVMLRNHVWSRVAPDEDLAVFGEEAEGLRAGRALLAFLDGVADNPPPGGTATILTNLADWRAKAALAVAWGAFANGLDDDALDAAALAIDLAPAGTTDSYVAQRDRLRAAIDEVVRDSAGVEQRLVQEIATLTAKVEQRRTFRWQSLGDTFLHDALVRVDKDLTVFLAGPYASLSTQHRWNGTVEHLTVTRFADRWEAARSAIAAADGVTASTLYRSEPPMQLMPQAGLVPIGMNPATWLWEFYDLRSAWDPRSDQDPATLPIPGFEDAAGRLTVGERTGIVFVLVPGGVSLVGATLKPGEPNHDPFARNNQTWPHDVRLAAYFLARHELTKAQWERLSLRDDPSAYGHLGPPTQPHQETRACPVESVTWLEATEVLSRVGLELPTEAQWEHACRAGSSTRFYVGQDEIQLAGHENLFDEGAAKVQLTRAKELGASAPFDDEWVFPAIVGFYRPNRWGLHDMLGNVSEWCRDEFDFYSFGPARDGDGLRKHGRLPGEKTIQWEMRPMRGGCASCLPRDATCSVRTPASWITRDGMLGLRASRSLRR